MPTAPDVIQYDEARLVLEQVPQLVPPLARSAQDASPGLVVAQMVAKPALKLDNVGLLAHCQPKDAIREAVSHAQLLTHELAQHSLADSAHAMHAEHLSGNEYALVGVRRAEVPQHLFDCGWPRQMLEWKQRDAKGRRRGILPLVGNTGRQPTLAGLALTDPVSPLEVERSVTRRVPVWRVHLGFLHHQRRRLGVHELEARRLSRANKAICRSLEVQ